MTGRDSIPPVRPSETAEGSRRPVRRLVEPGKRALPGAWKNPESGAVEYDASWRYEVGIPPDQLRQFDDSLAELGHRLGQKAIWRIVYEGGRGEAIPARTEPGK